MRKPYAYISVTICEILFLPQAVSEKQFSRQMYVLSTLADHFSLQHNLTFSVSYSKFTYTHYQQTFPNSRNEHSVMSIRCIRQMLAEKHHLIYWLFTQNGLDEVILSIRFRFFLHFCQDCEKKTD